MCALCLWMINTYFLFWYFCSRSHYCLSVSCCRVLCVVCFSFFIIIISVAVVALLLAWLSQLYWNEKFIGSSRFHFGYCSCLMYHFFFVGVCVFFFGILSLFRFVVLCLFWFSSFLGVCVCVCDFILFLKRSRCFRYIYSVDRKIENDWEENMILFHTKCDIFDQNIVVLVGFNGNKSIFVIEDWFATFELNLSYENHRTIHDLLPSDSIIEIIVNFHRKTSMLYVWKKNAIFFKSFLNLWSALYLYIWSKWAAS